jgi:hypothetical protein
VDALRTLELPHDDNCLYNLADISTMFSGATESTPLGMSIPLNPVFSERPPGYQYVLPFQTHKTADCFLYSGFATDELAWFNCLGHKGCASAGHHGQNTMGWLHTVHHAEWMKKIPHGLAFSITQVMGEIYVTLRRQRQTDTAIPGRSNALAGHYPPHQVHMGSQEHEGVVLTPGTILCVSFHCKMFNFDQDSRFVMPGTYYCTRAITDSISHVETFYSSCTMGPTIVDLVDDMIQTWTLPRTAPVSIQLSIVRILITWCTYYVEASQAGKPIFPG